MAWGDFVNRWSLCDIARANGKWWEKRMVAHGRSTVPQARCRPRELRANFSLGLTPRPWLERTAKAAESGGPFRRIVGPRLVGDGGRSSVTSARTARRCCLVQRGFGIAGCQAERSWKPGRSHGQRVLGRYSEPTLLIAQPMVLS